MKQLPWFRLYSEARNDAKLRTLDDSEHRIWFNLLCYAAEQSTRGRIEDTELVAIECAGGDQQALDRTLTKLARLRIVSRTDGEIAFVRFADRQYDKPSDQPEAVRERVARHRQRVSSSIETPVTRGVTRSNAQEKNREDQRRPDTDQTIKGASDKPDAIVSVPSEPYQHFEAFCSASGIDPDGVPKSDKGRQLRTAKEIMQAGYTSEQTRRCTVYMRSEAWRETPPDLQQVSRFLTRWKAMGEPVEPVLKSLAIANGRASPDVGPSKAALRSRQAVQEIADMMGGHDGTSG